MRPRSLQILVTGAAGNIGSRLVHRLLKDGHRVRALVLPNDPQAEKLVGLARCEIHRGDITRPETLAGALDGIDTVYHLAAVLLVEDEQLFERVNVGGTANVLLAATAANVRHFIHVSSASVVYPQTTPYSRSKRAGEALVRKQRVLAHTIIRPTLVYERGGGLEFNIFVDFLKRYPIVPLIGDGHALKNPVHADDIVAGLAAVAANDATVDQTYELCGGEEVSIRELMTLVLREQGLRKPFLPIPLPLCRAAAAVMGAVMKRPLLMSHTIAGLTQDANLDSSAARRDLGYRPVGIREGIKRC